MAKAKVVNEEPLEKQLWRAADKLRKNIDFKERFTALKAEFEAQLLEEAALNKAIAENLARVKLP
jgi:putative salt-induced outer membrane protein YdiY